MKSSRFPLLTWLTKKPQSAQRPDLLDPTCISKRDHDVPLPELLEIEPIHNCNLRCIMCHVSYEEMTRKKIDVDLVLKHLRALRGKWIAVGSAYEPMAHPQFTDLARGLTDLDMKIDLTTNGTFFTDKVIRQIKDCNFKYVTISFDGIRPETYEAIRRGADFYRTMDKILRFRDAVSRRGVDFRLNYTVMHSNIDEIPEAVDYWEKQGFESIGFIVMVMRNDNDLLRHESVSPMMDRLSQKLLEGARRVIEGKYRITMSTSGDFFHKPSALKAKYPGAFLGNRVRSDHPQSKEPWTSRIAFQRGKYPGMPVNCKSPFTFARVYYNGEVELCYQFKVGNLERQDFEQIWHGEQAKKVRQAVMRNATICHNCDYFRFCISAGEIDYQDKKNTVDTGALVQQGLEYRNPMLIETLGQVNIVRWLDSFYGLPQSLGPVDIQLLDPSRLPAGLIVDKSLERIRARIQKEAAQNTESSRRKALVLG
jgi:radical SAM protein with 4Fe4S-binding SPASM domain